MIASPPFSQDSRPLDHQLPDLDLSRSSLSLARPSLRLEAVPQNGFRKIAYVTNANSTPLLSLVLRGPCVEQLLAPRAISVCMTPGSAGQGCRECVFCARGVLVVSARAVWTNVLVQRMCEFGRYMRSKIWSIMRWSLRAPCWQMCTGLRAGGVGKCARGEDV